MANVLTFWAGAKGRYSNGDGLERQESRLSIWLDGSFVVVFVGVTAAIVVLIRTVNK